MVQQTGSGKKVKAVAVVGSNASGKSGAAIKLAKKFDGEVISADSRQVYRGLDIGSGKVQGKVVDGSDPLVFLSEGVVHYMIDIVEPNEIYTAGLFKRDAEKAMEHIVSREKLPIVCGGTGFWVKSLVYDYALPEVAPDWELREDLAKKSVLELFEMLQELDPKRAKEIDQNNPARLIRAIEVATELGSVPEIEAKPNPKYDFLQIGIEWPKEVLYERIEKRLDERLEGGMIEEVERLHKRGVSWERLERFGLEYRRVAEFLQGELTKEELRERWFLDDKQYAKRQMTWFKKDKSIVWLNAYEDIEDTVQKFLSDEPLDVVK